MLRQSTNNDFIMRRLGRIPFAIIGTDKKGHVILHKFRGEGRLKNSPLVTVISILVIIAISSVVVPTIRRVLVASSPGVAALFPVVVP